MKDPLVALVDDAAGVTCVRVSEGSGGDGGVDWAFAALTGIRTPTVPMTVDARKWRLPSMGCRLNIDGSPHSGVLKRTHGTGGLHSTRGTSRTFAYDRSRAAKLSGEHIDSVAIETGL